MYHFFHAEINMGEKEGARNLKGYRRLSTEFHESTTDEEGPELLFEASSKQDVVCIYFILINFSKVLA